MASSVIVGAGLLGLATAWHLQEYGVEVTIVDRVGVAAGSSWGNAGYLTPNKAVPLADPSLWTYGPRALLDPDAALHVPMRVDFGLWSFLARFAAHGTWRAWHKAMTALTPISDMALACFDELESREPSLRTRTQPFVIGFTDRRHADGFLGEMRRVSQHGQKVTLELLDRPRDFSQQLSDAVTFAYRLDGQRTLEPGPYTQALADAVLRRGGKFKLGQRVVEVNRGPRPEVVLELGEKIASDSVVIATGAWMSQLTRPLGVRTRVQSGRGYSFTVPSHEPVKYPIYLPHQRIACTPYRGRFRIAGTMEFRGPDEHMRFRRIEAMVKQVADLLTGLDLDQKEDVWVGARPVTPDGLPLVGATRSAGVYVAGGHGMWGMVLGPATGKLLAKQIVTGEIDPVITPFNPLR